MKKMSGIIKLRLMITTIFVLMTCLIIVSFLLGSISTQEDQEFVDSLSTREFNQMVEIYNNHPVTSSTDIVYGLVGLVMYGIDLLLFILVIKVWKTDTIS